MGIGLRVNQLNIHPHLIGRFLDAALEDVRYAKLLRDLAKIPGFALIALRRSARNYFQICDTSEACQDLVLDAVSEIAIGWVWAEVFKRQNGDSVCYRLPDELTFPDNPCRSCR